MDFMPSLRSADNRLYRKKSYLDWYMENSQLWTATWHYDESIWNYKRRRFRIQNRFLFAGSSVPDAPVKNPKDCGILLCARISVGSRYHPVRMAMITADKIYNFSGDKFFNIQNITMVADVDAVGIVGHTARDRILICLTDRANTLTMYSRSTNTTRSDCMGDKATGAIPYYLEPHDLLDQKIDAAAAIRITKYYILRQK